MENLEGMCLRVHALVRELLAAEEERWRSLRSEEHRFAWSAGVRAAPEIGIAYLLMPRLLVEFPQSHLWPERPVAGGRMDLWLSAPGTPMGEPWSRDVEGGVGIELKNVMSAKDAVTIPPQAARLQASPAAAALFVAWAHDEPDGSCPHPGQLSSTPGWSEWARKDDAIADCRYKGGDRILRLRTFRSFRLATSA